MGCKLIPIVILFTVLPGTATQSQSAPGVPQQAAPAIFKVVGTIKTIHGSNLIVTINYFPIS